MNTQQLWPMIIVSYKKVLCKILKPQSYPRRNCYELRTNSRAPAYIIHSFVEKTKNPLLNQTIWKYILINCYHETNNAFYSSQCKTDKEYFSPIYLFSFCNTKCSFSFILSHSHIYIHFLFLVLFSNRLIYTWAWITSVNKIHYKCKIYVTREENKN